VEQEVLTLLGMLLPGAQEVRILHDVSGSPSICSRWRRRLAKKDIARFHAAVQRLTAVAVAATPDYS
jgi:hypothetical protein